MKTRIFNAKVLTMQTSDCNIFEGEVWICDNRISYVGEKKDSSDIKWDKEIDAKGNLVMPGFKNAHTHSAMTFLRSYADDLPLQEWLFQQVFPMEAKLQGDDIYHLSKLAIMEYLSSGITSNFDMYMNNEMNAKASIDCGYRTVLCGSMNDFGGTVEGTEEEFLKFNELNPLISYQLGFHAEYTTKRESMEGLAALAQRHKAPLFTHLAETKNEVNGCMERYGMTPAKFLNELGMFEYGGGGFHCVHMTDEDMQIFRDKKISVVTNPSSNLKLASGIASLCKMDDMGINIGIGTDGPASNNCLDMFREMFLATALQKVTLEDASAMDANKVLYMATAGGAKAMCLPDCDTLEEGKLADLIMIDLHQPNMQPVNNIAKNVVYSGSKINVKLTMVNGNILYMDGKYDIGTEPEEVYKKANEIINSKR